MQHEQQLEKMHLAGPPTSGLVSLEDSLDDLLECLERPFPAMTAIIQKGNSESWRRLENRGIHKK